MMNRSRKWTVLHEIDGPHFTDEKIAENPGTLQLAAYSRFYNSSFYGEVSSLLLRLIQPTVNTNALGQRTSMRAPKDFDVDMKGVLLRNPFDLLASAVNRRPEGTWDAVLHRFGLDLDIVNWCVDNGFYIIRFDQMTASPEYLNGVLRDFGLADVTATKTDVRTRVNATKGRPKSLADLSARQKEVCDRMCGAFASKHGL